MNPTEQGVYIQKGPDGAPTFYPVVQICTIASAPVLGSGGIKGKLSLWSCGIYWSCPDGLHSSSWVERWPFPPSSEKRTPASHSLPRRPPPLDLSQGSRHW